MAAVHVRPARLAERPALRGLLLAASAALGYPREVMDRIAHGADDDEALDPAAIAVGRVLVAEDPAGGLAGFAAVGPVDGHGVAELTGLFVAPDRWREGIGVRLVDGAAAHAAALGAARLRVLADSGFYARTGWTRVGPATTPFGATAWVWERAVAGAAGYGPELARIHDEGFGAHARAAADEVIARLARAGLREGRVVDLGCGTGILAERLAAAGYDVLGVDQSPAMLGIARRRAPGATLVRGSVLDAGIPPCVAVTAVGEVLGYAFDARTGVTALRALARRAHDALVPGGLLLFDVATPGRGPARRVRRSLHEAPGWSIVVETREDAGRRSLDRRMVVFIREADGRYARVEETHVLNLMDPGEVTQALHDAGFAVRVLRRYAGLRFPAGLAGFAASA